MNRSPVIECVPNFSEGRRPEVINQIAAAVRSVQGATVLHIDQGYAANRTVITFAGQPDAICEAAFQAAKAAAELIDMRHHHGEHPRIGATDVLPLVPVSGISLDACALLARQLAFRMADELGIPCYLYEAAALKPAHRNLADCRKGEYEAIARKLADPGLAPDVMPHSSFLMPQPTYLRTGCSVVGARDFLLAVNFNLNTRSSDEATAIARKVRQSGYKGQPGTLRAAKAIGWYIEEYGCAQVSMNLCNLHETSLHTAYLEVSRQAEARGVKVTGTEIIGLVPMETILAAGRHFCGETEADEDLLISTAIRQLGLDSLRPFLPEEKILEKVLQKTKQNE